MIPQLKVTVNFDYDASHIGRGAQTNKKISVDASECSDESWAVLKTKKFMKDWAFESLELKYQQGKIALKQGDDNETAIKALRESNFSVSLLPKPKLDAKTGQMVDVEIKPEIEQNRNNIDRVLKDITTLATENHKPLRFAFQGVASVVEESAPVSQSRLAYFDRHHGPR